MSYLKRLDEIFSSSSKRSMPPGFSMNDIQSLDQFLKSETQGQQSGKIEEKGKIDDANVKPINIDVLKAERLKKWQSPKRGEEPIPWATRDVKMLHRKAIVDANGKLIDNDKLRAMIMQRPEHIIAQNEKLAKSGVNQIFYDLTLPAYQGLIVDESTGEFEVVRTCPSAGDCKKHCYASRGTYIMFVGPVISSARTVNFLMNDYDGFKAQLLSELNAAVKSYNPHGVDVVLRWHDSGDFLSEKYLLMAYDIAKETPNVLHYAYTKQVPMVNKLMSHKPENFIFNYSFGGEHDKDIDITKDKYAKVVPKKTFKDLPVTKKRGKPRMGSKLGPVLSVKFEEPEIQELKRRVSKEFDLNPRTLITYDELRKIPYNKNNRWDVLVWKGHGDDSAARRDVGGTFLLFH